MSDRDYIFLSGEGAPQQIAEWVAARCGMEIFYRGDDGPYLSRPARTVAVGTFGGLIQPNHLAGSDPNELIEAFPVNFALFYALKDESVQLAESKLLFTELAEDASQPMVLTHGVETLVAGWSPSTGLVWLPEDTSPSAEDRALWEPFRARPGAE